MHQQNRHGTLKIVSDNPRPVTPLADIVAAFAQQIEDRRAQLNADLIYYQEKIQDMQQLDPSDQTGLQRIYNLHLKHINKVLALTESDPEDETQV